MTPDNPVQPRAASPPATSWIVAAIVLVLHWAAPGPFQFQPVASVGAGVPAMSADTRASQPGTLPRVQPRSATCEAGLPKAPLKRVSAGEKPYALAPELPLPITKGASSVQRGADRALLPHTTKRHFDARGPPLLKA